MTISPTPIIAAAMCASGARSPDAPTEPCAGHDRHQAAARASLAACRWFRAARPMRPARGSRASAPSSAARSPTGAGSPTPAACDSTMLRCSARQVGRLDAHAREFAETGVDAVDRLALARRCAATAAALAATRGPAGRVERDGGAAIDGAPFGERRPAPGSSRSARHLASPDARVQRIEARCDRRSSAGRSTSQIARSHRLAGFQRADLVGDGPARAPLRV